MKITCINDGNWAYGAYQASVDITHETVDGAVMEVWLYAERDETWSLRHAEVVELCIEFGGCRVQVRNVNEPAALVDGWFFWTDEVKAALEERFQSSQRAAREEAREQVSFEGSTSV